jgi:hypothetical protein
VAQKVTVILADDIDGGPADETVRFALDGKTYEIDLSDVNAAAFRAAVGPWAEKARKAGGQPARRARGTKGGRDLNAVRAWAREAGYQVSDRGRVSGEVLALYDAAH